MLNCQKHLFRLPEEVSYLNGAYFSPLLIESEQAVLATMQLMSQPFRLPSTEFFEPVQRIKQLFAQLINAESPDQICLIPAVSYGMATVSKNVPLKAGQEIVLTEGQFPSNYYAWEREARAAGAQLRIVGPEAGHPRRGQSWNEQILAAIGPKTAVVALGHIHWADGTLFDLKAIREKTRQHGALLIIDGSQSVGALPFDQSLLEVDALICAGYKWLLGPYGIGLAYLGPYFDQGRPIEDSWLNRLDSDDFSQLVNYQPAYRPGAARYSAGEHSNMLNVAVLEKALEQLLQWQVPQVQGYCQRLVTPFIDRLRAAGGRVEEAAYRVDHLFGVQMPKTIDPARLHQRLKEQDIYVSLRGTTLRIAPNVYNESQDLERLVQEIDRAVTAAELA